MQRCFLKFPQGVAHLDASPAFDLDRERLKPYFGKTDNTVLIANLAPEELAAAQQSGAKAFDDVLFHPAEHKSNPFEFAPKHRFWEQVADPLANQQEPWVSKALPDVLAQANVDTAWTKTKGAGVTIVIIDSGIDGTAPEFPASRRSALSFSPSFPDGPWLDKLGHGTMVASIATGSTLGGGKYNGVAPEATILSARTTYASSDLYAIYDHLISLKKSGAISGPIVVNNSYQLTQCNPDGRLPRDHPYAEIIEAAIQSGIVMVFAAGNNHADMLCGNDPDQCAPNTIWAVNSLDDIICVGAVNWNDSNLEGAHGNSSRGPGEWTSSSSKPDCVAPCYGEVRFGTGYRVLEWWGTSGSAPVVSGVIALMLSNANSKGLSLTPAEVSTILRKTSRAIPTETKNCVGAGVVDCAAAVSLV